MTESDDRGPGMDSSGLHLHTLLDLLPDLDDLAGLREELLAASAPDARLRWTRGGGYATLDARVLPSEVVGEAVRAAVRKEVRRVELLVGGVGRAVTARLEGRPRDALREFLETALGLMEDGRWADAAALLEHALEGVAPTHDRLLERDLARHLAKCLWREGRLEEAAAQYTRTQALSQELGDERGTIVGLQGLGNVRAAQGRWSEAEALHGAALDRCGDDDELLEGQIANNLSQVVRRQGRLSEAREWQERAEAIWERIESPADRVVALNNAGLLRLAEGGLDEAEEALADALRAAWNDLQRAAVLINLARVHLAGGRYEEAAEVGRDAEEFCVLSGASDQLVEVYTVLGCVMRAIGDDRGVTFFEKAIELGSDGRFPLELGLAHLEYARLRRALGDAEEADARLRIAADLFEQLGAGVELAQVREELGRA